MAVKEILLINKQTLNDEQKEAFDLMYEFVNSPKDGSMFLLKGFAGSGKTYCISRLVDALKRIKPGRRIAMTAPTNKAVAVLKESSGLSDVNYKTIHALLGLKEVIDKETGQQRFEKDFDSEYSTILKYGVLIIDEVSMLEDKLFFDIKKHSKKVKIIMMGDPAQIPPVNKLDCEPFLNPEKHNIREYQLSKIMRQAGDSDIPVRAYDVRSAIDTEVFKFVPGEGFNVYSRDKDRALIKQAFEKTFNGENNARVISWTNRSVSNYNSYIRKLLYGENLEKILVGEKLIMNSPWRIMEGLSLHANQEIEVISKTQNGYEVDLEDLGKESFICYDAGIKFLNDVGSEEYATIRILHESSEDLFKQKLNSIAALAISSKKEERGHIWQKWYRLKRSFADISYAYAITAHKSQGSTYHCCFVDSANIHQNPNTIEKNRILYTALTRAKKEVHLIQ